MDNLQKSLVDEVRRFAQTNYEMDGWDYIVECYSDEDILELIGGSKTAKGAIRNVAAIAKIKNERRQDAISEIF